MFLDGDSTEAGLERVVGTATLMGTGGAGLTGALSGTEFAATGLSGGAGEGVFSTTGAAAATGVGAGGCTGLSGGSFGSFTGFVSAVLGTGTAGAAASGVVFDGLGGFPRVWTAAGFISIWRLFGTLAAASLDTGAIS